MNDYEQDIIDYYLSNITNATYEVLKISKDTETTFCDILRALSKGVQWFKLEESRHE